MMLKSKLWAFVLGAALFASCEEQGPAINLEEAAVDPSDTSYILTNIPTPQPRKVLMEEFTGVKCPNCPAGHEIIKSILDGPNGSQLVSVALYPNNYALTEPIAEGSHQTEDDFRTPESTQIVGKYFGGIPSMPTAGFDRFKFGTELLKGRASWVNDFNSRRMEASPVNIELESSYDPATDMVKVKITSTFTAEFNHKVYMTACIVQDSIYDYQERQGTGGIEIIEDYLHQHVFRGFIVPNENGIQLGDDLHEAGRVYVRTLNFKLSDLAVDNSYLNMQHVEPKHCRVVVYLHRADLESFEVLQANEVHME